jgi:3-hydroxybutyryl-CoA dehydrogenase
MALDLRQTPVLVVGSGIMGAGIAQVAALAGHRVKLHDARTGAAEEARRSLAATLDALTSKGKLTGEAAQAAIARIEPIKALGEAHDVGLALEAIVENLDAKRQLFRELEGIVSPMTVLATNTSSISVTAIANGLQHPGRLVGMHFFNPVPLMKLVEVVHGLQTEPLVAEAITDLSHAWGKIAVAAKSTPGFIVNRIARPYYAETLALLQEQAATPQVLDACLKAAGFRMGPCELMDLIGHDTNFSVTRSVYDANFQDKRYVPSGLQAEMVGGGLLGRKTGRGFYAYPPGVPALPVAVHDAPATAGEVVVHGHGPIADHLEQAATAALAPQGWGPGRDTTSGWTGLAIDGARLVMTDGRTAQHWAHALGTPDTAVFDRVVAPSPASGTALAYALAPAAGDPWRTQAPAWLAALGFAPLPVADAPGLVVARTIAMLVNEAADAVLQGVCTADGADAAMKLGVNYPAGPFEWLARWSADGVAGVVRALDDEYRGERYRLSPWLRRRLSA